MSDLNLLAIALDSIGDPILIHDKDFRLLRANQAAADRLGIHRAALHGRPLNAVLTRNGNGNGWKQCPYCEDMAGSGEEIDHWFGGYLHASTSNFHEPVSRSVATVHVLRDVTGKRQTEEKYRTLFENVQEGVFISTPDGRFFDFNDAFLRITGYENRADLMGTGALSIFVDPQDRRRLQEELKRNGAVRDFEFRIRRRDGAVRVVSESSIATRDVSGEVLFYQGFLLDVTERSLAEQELRRRNEELTRLHEETQLAYENLRRAQEQLLQSEKMAAVGQLISGVAHELNNPLTAILGYSQLLADEAQTSENSAQYVDRLYRQAQRTHRIVQNLLSFARQRPPERCAISLAQVLEDTLVLREYELRLNNITVHREVAPELPRTFADPHQLQQVVLNILNNAVDAILESNRRGDIRIRAWPEGDTVRMEFIDSGPGVSDPSRVFDPFYTTKPVGKGTGLGLSICYGLIKEHGGDITVRNVPPRGACFTITLPALPADAKAKPDAGPAAATANFGALLLVDDEETVLDLEAEVLRGHSTVIHTARSGREAIAQLEAHRVDAVITDLKMPGEVSGEELYEWVVRHRPDIAHRVVFTVSDADDQRVRALLRRSGCAHLQKPFRLQDLQLVLQQVFSIVAAPQSH